MNCLTCSRLVTLGVYAVMGAPEKGMICWPCHLESFGPAGDGSPASMVQIINHRGEEE